MRKTIASNGYVLVRVGRHHHLADVRGYAYEHRLVAEKALGRRLNEKEIVHHRNGNKIDNSPDNLEVCESIAHHRLQHRTSTSRLRKPNQENPEVICRCGCGRKQRQFDEAGRFREYISGHNPQPAPTAGSILALLSAAPLHRREIASKAGLSIRQAAVALSRLRRKGMVEPAGRGTWQRK